MRKALLLLAALGAAPAASQTVSTMVESLEASGDVSIAKDWTLYIADFGATIRTAGGQHVYRLPAGQPLSIFSSGFGGASGNEIGPDGHLYQSDVGRGEVYRISGDGKRTRIAEGLKSPVGIAPAADGSVYVVQCSANIISRIGQDGTLTTVAEGAPLNCPNGLAFSPDGSLYAANFRDGNLVRVELPTGRMSVMAAIPGGSNGHLAWGNDRFYLASFGGHRLYEIGTDGAVCPLAGTGEPGNEDGPAHSATFFRPNGMAVSPDGDSLYTNTVHVTEQDGNPGLHPNALRKVSGLRSRPSCTAAAGEDG